MRLRFRKDSLLSIFLSLKSSSALTVSPIKSATMMLIKK